MSNTTEAQPSSRKTEVSHVPLGTFPHHRHILSRKTDDSLVPLGKAFGGNRLKARYRCPLSVAPTKTYRIRDIE